MNFILPAGKQAYFEQVWSYVRQVPYGKVVTYGQIAQSLPKPEDPELIEEVHSAARLVGSAMAACPDDVPWHRVLNAQGCVSNRPDAGRQQQLLEAEGIQFYRGRINLDEHQWYGDSETDEPRQQKLF